MPKERDVIKMIWTNFVNSLRPRQFKGNYMGRDTFGNKYFEIPAGKKIRLVHIYLVTLLKYIQLTVSAKQLRKKSLTLQANVQRLITDCGR